MTLLYLVRHGDTPWEPEQRIKGQLDVPLSAHGREQALAVAEALRGRCVDIVYCSTLRRTQEGARLIAAAAKAPVLATPLIDERHWGAWQGLTAEEVARERCRGRTGRDGFAPLGEPAKAFATRVDRFLALVAAGRRNQTVVAVTHGGVLKNAVIPALGLAVSNRSAFAAGTGTVSLLQHDGCRWRPVLLNCDPTEAGEMLLLNGSIAPVRDTVCETGV